MSAYLYHVQALGHYTVLRAPRCSILFAFRPRQRTCCKHYTTHRQASSPILTSLHRRQNQDAGSEEFVGPFQLGIPPQSIQCGEKVKRWSELNTAAKGPYLILYSGYLTLTFPDIVVVLRMTQRTTNLTVILLGAGLSIVLIYALTSELFSKNSPTVLFNESCERIKASPQVRHIFIGTGVSCHRLHGASWRYDRLPSTSMVPLYSTTTRRLPFALVTDIDVWHHK